MHQLCPELLSLKVLRLRSIARCISLTLTWPPLPPGMALGYDRLPGFRGRHLLLDAHVPVLVD